MRLCSSQVLSPVTSSVLAEKAIRVVDDKVSVTELGVQLISGLTLSLQLNSGSSRAIVATATTREMITQLKQVTKRKLSPHNEAPLVLLPCCLLIPSLATIQCNVKITMTKKEIHNGG